MPLKVNVGLSKKIGQPDYGSLGASCHVEYEAEASQLNTDLEAFQRQVKNAFIACRQAVQDELHRHQAAAKALPATTAEAAGNGDGSGNGSGHYCSSSPTSPPVRSGQAAGGVGNGQRHSNSRKATASQVRALEAISNRLQFDLQRWLHEKFGLRMASDLTIAEASAAIDELNATPASNGADH